MAATGE
jgi:hypothetical protein